MISKFGPSWDKQVKLFKMHNLYSDSFVNLKCVKWINISSFFSVTCVILSFECLFIYAHNSGHRFCESGVWVDWVGAEGFAAVEVSLWPKVRGPWASPAPRRQRASANTQLGETNQLDLVRCLRVVAAGRLSGRERQQRQTTGQRGVSDCLRVSTSIVKKGQGGHDAEREWELFLFNKRTWRKVRRVRFLHNVAMLILQS